MKDVNGLNIRRWDSVAVAMRQGSRSWIALRAVVDTEIGTGAPILRDQSDEWARKYPYKGTEGAILIIGRNES